MVNETKFEKSIKIFSLDDLQITGKIKSVKLTEEYLNNNQTITIESEKEV